MARLRYCLCVRCHFYAIECQPFLDACDEAEAVLGHPLRPMLYLMGETPVHIPICWQPRRDPHRPEKSL